MIVTLAIVAGVVALSFGLSIVEFRRYEQLAFRCMRCGREFRGAAHRARPRRCPHCKASDWQAL